MELLVLELQCWLSLISILLSMLSLPNLIINNTTLIVVMVLVEFQCLEVNWIIKWIKLEECNSNPIVTECNIIKLNKHLDLLASKLKECSMVMEEVCNLLNKPICLLEWIWLSTSTNSVRSLNNSSSNSINNNSNNISNSSNNQHLNQDSLTHSS